MGEVDFEESSDVPMTFLCVLVVLLVLLAAAIWIAFFSALRKALKRLTEIKEYRRRQNVLAALANGPITDSRTPSNLFAPFTLGCDQSLTGAYIRQISTTLNVPPTYEEAIRGQQTTSPYSPTVQQQQQQQQQQQHPSTAAATANLVATTVNSSPNRNPLRPNSVATLSHMV